MTIVLGFSPSNHHVYALIYFSVLALYDLPSISEFMDVVGWPWPEPKPPPSCLLAPPDPREVGKRIKRAKVRRLIGRNKGCLINKEKRKKKPKTNQHSVEFPFCQSGSAVLVVDLPASCPLRQGRGGKEKGLMLCRDCPAAAKYTVLVTNPKPSTPEAAVKKISSLLDNGSEVKNWEIDSSTLEIIH